MIKNRLAFLSMEWNVETISRCCGKKSNTMLSLEELLSMRQLQTPKKYSNSNNNSNNNSNVNYLKGNSRTNSSKEQGLRINTTPIRKEIERKYSTEFSKLTDHKGVVNDLTALGIFWCRTKTQRWVRLSIFFNGVTSFMDENNGQFYQHFTFSVLTPIIFCPVATEKISNDKMLMKLRTLYWNVADLS